MAKAFGIVNTSGNHIWVEGMQDYRPIGAFSFMGRYRITDFPISNLSNSDIDRIQVFAGANPRSLIEHVGSGRHYNINSKRGKLQILFAESQSKNDIYNTDIAAFWANLDNIQKMKEEKISIRELARRADVSPTIIQKLRSEDARKVNLTTLTSVLKCLGYQIKLERIPSPR